MSGNTSLDDNKAEFVIASCPGIRFTAWFDPDRDWLSVEGRDESGMLRGVGCRMTPATTPFNTEPETETESGGDDGAQG